MNAHQSLLLGGQRQSGYFGGSLFWSIDLHVCTFFSPIPHCLVYYSFRVFRVLKSVSLRPSTLFFHQLVWLHSYSSLACWYGRIYWFLNIVPALHIWSNVTWLWYVILFMHNWIQLGNILLIFAFMLMKDMSLFSFLIMSLSGWFCL